MTAVTGASHQIAGVNVAPASPAAAQGAAASTNPAAIIHRTIPFFITLPFAFTPPLDVFDANTKTLAN